ncbi:MAG: TonB-dependent receptor family protein [Flavobacteriia bacterium]|jgi:Fe(3+) dicitrate transport protein
MVRAFLICVSFCFVNQLFSQLDGIVVDQNKEKIYHVLVTNGKEKVYTDFGGKFILVQKLADSLTFFHPEFEQKTVTIDELFISNSQVTLKKLQQLDEIKVIQKRNNLFDIGYLPPVRGVQIATGTSSIIQTESQNGAKSTGNPRELFAKVPGLNIWESDGAGIQMGVGGRGLSPNRAANFNTRQNGYDISADALGYPESYYTPPLEALSQIEIIRGSASLQYGTQFGGLMNFVIKDPVKNSPFEFTSRNTLGSFGYFGTFNRISGTAKRFAYQVYHQLKKGDGYRLNSEFLQHQFFAQLGYYINEKQHIRLEYTGMKYDSQQAGGLTDVMFLQDPKQSIRERNWFEVNWNILALHYDFEISKKSLFNVRAFGMNSNRYSIGFLGKINQADLGGNRELIAGDFKNAGLEARFLKKYNLFRTKPKGEKAFYTNGAFLTGARYYQGITSSLQGLASDSSDANFTFLNPKNLEYSHYDFPSQNISFFMENIWFFGPKFTANAGFRLDYIQSASQGFYKKYSIHPLNNDTLGIYQISDTNSLKRTVPLFGAGMSYRPSKFTSIYGNFCLNYRAVNFNDIRVSNPNVIVDTLIKDEFGSTTEIGFRGAVKPYLYVDVALFHLFYGNKIGLAPEPNGVNKIRTNIGDARNYGVEAFAEMDFFKAFNDSAKNSLSAFVNFSYIKATYIRSKESNFIGKDVEYVSPIMLRSGIKFKTKRFTTQIQFSYNSGQYSDASNAVEASGDAVIGFIPAYSVMDFSVRYEFKKWFQAEAGVNNVLNAKYYTRRATAYPGPGILPSDGRSFYVTLQYKFRK